MLPPPPSSNVPVKEPSLPRLPILNTPAKGTSTDSHPPPNVGWAPTIGLAKVDKRILTFINSKFQDPSTASPNAVVLHPIGLSKKKNTATSTTTSSTDSSDSSVGTTERTQEDDGGILTVPRKKEKSRRKKHKRGKRHSKSKRKRSKRSKRGRR
ncbi:unnamed protein product [Meloidogyne enterolobii]|uniref:Uncharacterized protein n=1 Tax=Meloidogyne enterolobii TaxID=390850 RepID=A0ACB0Z884_MELEN